MTDKIKQITAAEIRTEYSGNPDLTLADKISLVKSRNNSNAARTRINHNYAADTPVGVLRV